MELDKLLYIAVEKNASDLHLSEGEVPIVRVDGDLQRLELPVLDRTMLLKMLDDMMTAKQKQAFEEKLQLDFAYSLGDTNRVRINVFNQYRGLSAALRIIPFATPTLASLGFDEDIYPDICELPNGLVLVTGPTGSGKSTTLAAMLNYINCDSGRYLHIMTVEDPIEYVYQSHNCLFHQREVGDHTLGFNDSLRGALREDPDIILVGEMRDLETIRLALTAAETGHLVFATLHTRTASTTIYRIVDGFPSGEKDLIRSKLAESLRAVIAQTLLKKPGGGRVAVSEILLTTPAVRNLIREGKIAQLYSSIETGKEMGMRTLRQHFDSLYQANKVIMPDDDRITTR